MVNMQSILLEHTDRIAAVETECASCRANVLAGIQAEISEVNGKIGEEPNADAGLEGSGVLRQLSVLSERLSPLVKERADSAARRARLPDRIKTCVAIISVVIAAATMAIRCNHNPAGASRGNPHSIGVMVDASVR